MKKSDPTYAVVHERIKKLRGPASGYACVDCGAPARDWSYSNAGQVELVSPMGSRYSADPNDYHPRCARCHGKFDAGHQKVVPDNVLSYLSRAEVAERIGVKPDTLSRRYALPEPDAMTGQVRGWLPETIDRWNAARPGRGGRPRRGR